MLLTNINNQTGIRYGTISQHSIGGDVLSDVLTQGDDLDLEQAHNDIRADVEHLVRRHFSRFGADPTDEMCRVIMEAFDEDYRPDNPTIRYARDGYVVDTLLDSDLIFTQSLYAARCRLCSPCVPNAGDLDSPEENGFWAYCPGPDWFDDDRPCSFPIYEICDGTFNLVYTPSASQES